MNKNCQDFERLISAQMDGAISQAEEAALNEHLRECRECREFQESAKEYRQLLRSLPEAEDEASVSVRGAVDSKPRSFWGRRLAMPVPIAAVLALVMLVGWLLALFPPGERASQRPTKSMLVQSVEIVQVTPATATLVGAGNNDSANKKKESLL
jgi:anti-sigma factor RsiW